MCYFASSAGNIFHLCSNRHPGVERRSEIKKDHILTTIGVQGTNKQRHRGKRSDKRPRGKRGKVSLIPPGCSLYPLLSPFNTSTHAQTFRSSWRFIVLHMLTYSHDNSSTASLLKVVVLPANFAKGYMEQVWGNQDKLCMMENFFSTLFHVVLANNPSDPYMYTFYFRVVLHTATSMPAHIPSLYIHKRVARTWAPSFFPLKVFSLFFEAVVQFRIRHKWIPLTTSGAKVVGRK